MSLEFIRHNYKVPAKRGGRVRLRQGFNELRGREGTILSADHRLRVRLDGDHQRVVLHPTWELEYLTQETDHA